MIDERDEIPIRQLKAGGTKSSCHHRQQCKQRSGQVAARCRASRQCNAEQPRTLPNSVARHFANRIPVDGQ
jgi:hypothetical protein